MKFEFKNRWTDEPQFTADLEYSEAYRWAQFFWIRERVWEMTRNQNIHPCADGTQVDDPFPIWYLKHHPKMSHYIFKVSGGKWVDLVHSISFSAYRLPKFDSIQYWKLSTREIVLTACHQIQFTHTLWKSEICYLRELFWIYKNNQPDGKHQTGYYPLASLHHSFVRKGEKTFTGHYQMIHYRNLEYLSSLYDLIGFDLVCLACNKLTWGMIVG